MARKHLLLLFTCFALVTLRAQTYNPIIVVGFNQDVIAEGTGPSSLAVTSKEMDAITPSNFVICTDEFATANSIPTGYGIPSTGTISSGNKNYQLAPLGNGTSIENNVVYLMKGDMGTLTLLTPATYSSLSFLVTATEGNANVSAKVNYTDGTNQTFTFTVLDWVGSTTAVISGFGRIKRIAGPFTTGTYEQSPTNPRIYSAEVTVNCSKVVSSIDFTNTSTGGATSNRAFIFAVSGNDAALPVAPDVQSTNDSICAGLTTVLSVQNPDPALTYSWYSASTGGTALATATTFTTPALSATTTYYVQSANAGGCASTRTPFTVTILPTPANAIVKNDTICSGQTATLTITNATGGVTYTWYDSATGGNLVFTGNSYTTPALTDTVTYYIEASNGSACVSTRTAVTVLVTPQPVAPAATAAPVCAGQTATINVTNPVAGVTYSYYTAATGGTALGTGTSYTTPAVTTTVDYYIEAGSGSCVSSTRTLVTVTVAPQPAAPAATAPSVCAGQAAVISITSPDATLTYSYYTAATGGTAIATGTSYTTPAVTTSVTYYIEAANGSCISPRTAVTVTVAPQPAAPVATAAPVCAGQLAVINITSPDATLTYSYYTTSTGGTVLGTGTSFTTPALTGTTTYYVDASNGSCISPTRTAVIITVTPAPAAPAATAAPICAGGTATISITSPDPTLTYSYYSAATGGTALGTGTSYTTPVLTGTTTYYIDAAVAGGCVSVRTPITVTVTPLPSAPAATVTAVCAGQAATINITSPDAALTYSYYPTATGGTAVGTGTSYVTPAITGSVTYYIEASTSGGCISVRTPVTVSIAPPPAAPTATVVAVCTGQTATINITSPDPSLTYSYYTAATGGTAVGTGTSFTTPPVTGSVTYYVEASTSGGCISVRTPVTVNIAPPPAAPAATVAQVCSGQTATINITSPDPSLTYSYYTTATGGVAVGTGTSFTTPAVTGTVTYYIDATNSTGCVSPTRTAVTVTVAAVLATPVVTVTSVTATTATFTWSPVTGATGYQVSVNNGAFTTPSSGAAGTTHTVTGLASGQTVTIAVKALGAMTCQNSAPGTASVVTPSTEIYIPNTFTPNGDGRNDRLMIYGGSSIVSLDFKIYSQWGEVIYASTDNSRGWDGTYKGKAQPVGVYAYVASITLRDGSKLVRKGTVNLIR